jgi:hypothetical protein
MYASSRHGLASRDQRFDISAMIRDDAADFRPRTGRIRDRGRASAGLSRSFVAQVMKAAAKANGGPLTQAQFTGGKPRGRGSAKGRCSRIGRGQAVADQLKRQAAERSPGQRQRRVVVKARIVDRRTTLPVWALNGPGLLNVRAVGGRFLFPGSSGERVDLS